MGTLIVGFLIFLAAGLVVRKMIIDKKQGKICIGGCGDCSRSSTCSFKIPDENKDLEEKKLI